MYFCYSYCVPFSVLLDGVWLSRNKRITYLLTYLLLYVTTACQWTCLASSWDVSLPTMINTIRRRCVGAAILALSTNVITYLLTYLLTSIKQMLSGDLCIRLRERSSRLCGSRMHLRTIKLQKTEWRVARKLQPETSAWIIVDSHCFTYRPICVKSSASVELAGVLQKRKIFYTLKAQKSNNVSATAIATTADKTTTRYVHSISHHHQSGVCNCNWGTCIAPPTRRPRAHHRVNPYPGARRQNETEMFSDHDETSPSTCQRTSHSYMYLVHQLLPVSVNMSARCENEFRNW